jgi:hypothetical protein
LRRRCYSRPERSHYRSVILLLVSGRPDHGIASRRPDSTSPYQFARKAETANFGCGSAEPFGAASPRRLNQLYRSGCGTSACANGLLHYLARRVYSTTSITRPAPNTSSGLRLNERNIRSARLQGFPDTDRKKFGRPVVGVPVASTRGVMPHFRKTFSSTGLGLLMKM